jgi:type IV secretion system protein VirD4
LSDGQSGTSYWKEPTAAYQSGMIWLGRDQYGDPTGIEDNRHIVTVAGSRAGKGTSLIVPNLLSYPGSVVVIDPKGENAALTARHRATFSNHRVIVLDPFNEARQPEELRGAYNPLDLIDPLADDAIDLAGALASALVMRSNDKDAHWDESAKQIIEALILHVCETEDRAGRRRLARVYQLLMRGDAEFSAAIDEQAIAAGDEPPEMNNFKALWMHMSLSEAENENVRDVIVGAAETLQAMGESERGSVLSTARRNTRFLATPSIQKVLGSTTFDLEMLKTHEGGASLYLCLPARYLASHTSRTNRWSCLGCIIARFADLLIARLRL